MARRLSWACLLAGVVLGISVNVASAQVDTGAALAKGEPARGGYLNGGYGDVFGGAYPGYGGYLTSGYIERNPERPRAENRWTTDGVTLAPSPDLYWGGGSSGHEIFWGGGSPGWVERRRGGSWQPTPFSGGEWKETPSSGGEWKTDYYTAAATPSRRSPVGDDARVVWTGREYFVTDDFEPYDFEAYGPAGAIWANYVAWTCAVLLLAMLGLWWRDFIQHMWISCAAARDAYVEGKEELPNSDLRRGPVVRALHVFIVPVVSFVLLVTGAPADLVKHSRSG